MNDKMLELAKAMKEECDIINCNQCTISKLCSETFRDDPNAWELPEQEEEKKEQEEEETSIVVVKERLEELIDFIDRFTSNENCCYGCPLYDKSCNGTPFCQDRMLAWLQGQPVI